VLHLLSAAMPVGTRLAYSRDQLDWVAWCQQEDTVAIPASPEQIAAYVAQLLTVGSPSVAARRPLQARTVERRLSAISRWSRDQGHGRADLDQARDVLRGHLHLAGDPRPAKAAPITVSVLRALVSQATSRRRPDGSLTHRALRDRAILLVAFGVGARRSELVALDLEDFIVGSEGLEVRVFRAKNRSHADTVAVPWAADAALCPVRAFVEHRDALAQVGVTVGAAFRRVTRTDVVLEKRIAAETVADVVRQLAESAGIPVTEGYRGWSAHSLRRGMATEARRNGADAIAISRQGGWAPGSTALAGYLEDIDRWARHPLRGVL
jgi:integrase